MLKRIGIIAGLLLLVSLPAAATEYSSVIEDMPLMAGMVETPADTVVFDKPAGRIVEIGAQTSAAAAEVDKFYNAALPPLGWKTAAPLKFTRDSETLQISIEQTEAATHVHFTLTPNSEGK